MTKTVFVTVGTTLFEDLIQSVTDPLFLKQIASHGYNRLIVQYGKGKTPQIRNSHHDQNDGNQKIITLQEGQMKGTYELSDNSTMIEWEIYRFKSSLQEDMQNADLIISHAGAGSIMEGMEHCRNRNCLQDNNDSDKLCDSLKKLVVVINDKLMDNHQCELAYALEKRNYLYVLSKPEMVLDTNELDNIVKKFRPKFFEGGNDTSFGILVENFMGYNNNKSN